jgi:hypothetical protein
MSSTPDTKKKKHALPSLLSNIRNAQAAMGRSSAADDFNEREIHYPLMGTNGDLPLMVTNGAGVGSRMAASSSSRPPNLQRGPPSSNLSSTLNNFSQRFGNQWRKHKRRKKVSGSGATGVPQEFYVAVGCFFFAFPVFFILYILARRSVFGDEGYGSGTQVQKHEVPANIFVNPDDEIRGAGFGVNQNVLDGEVTIDLESQVKEGDDTQEASIELGTIDEAEKKISNDETSGQRESVDDSIIATEDDKIKDSSAKNMDEATGDNDVTSVASGRQDPVGAEKSMSNEMPSTSKGEKKANTSSDQMEVIKPHDKLRSLHSTSKLKEENAESTYSSDLREYDDMKMETVVNLRASYDEKK